MSQNRTRVYHVKAGHLRCAACKAPAAFSVSAIDEGWTRTYCAPCAAQRGYQAAMKATGEDWSTINGCAGCIFSQAGNAAGPALGLCSAPKGARAEDWARANMKRPARYRRIPGGEDRPFWLAPGGEGCKAFSLRAGWNPCR